MSVLEVNDDNELHNLVANNERVVVDFSAPGWCVPCKRLAPHFKAVAERMPDVKFIEVDIDKAEEIRDAYQIQSVPFVVMFKNGTAVGELKGRTSVALVGEISSYR